jgi:hypothetical protein
MELQNYEWYEKFKDKNEEIKQKFKKLREESLKKEKEKQNNVIDITKCYKDFFKDEDDYNKYKREIKEEFGVIPSNKNINIKREYGVINDDFVESEQQENHSYNSEIENLKETIFDLIKQNEELKQQIENLKKNDFEEEDNEVFKQEEMGEIEKNETLSNYTSIFLKDEVLNLRLENFYNLFKIYNKTIRFNKSEILLTNNILNIESKRTFYNNIKNLTNAGFITKIKDCFYKVVQNQIDNKIFILNNVLQNLDFYFKYNKYAFKLYIYLLIKFRSNYNQNYFIFKDEFKKIREELSFRTNRDILSHLAYLEKINLVDFKEEQDKFIAKLKII